MKRVSRKCMRACSGGDRLLRVPPLSNTQSSTLVSCWMGSMSMFDAADQSCLFLSNTSSFFLPSGYLSLCIYAYIYIYIFTHIQHKLMLGWLGKRLNSNSLSIKLDSGTWILHPQLLTGNQRVVSDRQAVADGYSIPSSCSTPSWFDAEPVGEISVWPFFR